MGEHVEEGCPKLSAAFYGKSAVVLNVGSRSDRQDDSRRRPRALWRPATWWEGSGSPCRWQHWPRLSRMWRTCISSHVQRRRW